METNEPTLSTGAAEHGGAVVYVDHSAGPDRTGVTVMPPRHAKTQTMAVLASALALATPTSAIGMATASAARRSSPYLDLATKHGTAAALKAEAPHVHRENASERRADQRDARRRRRAAQRRRGW